MWLRNNVYKRVTRPGKSAGFGALITTFFVSALWHGLAPGYYMTFLLGGFYQYFARLLRRYVRPIFFADRSTPDPTLETFRRYTVAQNVYSILSRVSVQLTINYAALSFILLHVGTSLRAYRSVDYYGYVIVIVGLVAFQLGLGNVLKRFHAKPLVSDAKETKIT